MALGPILAGAGFTLYVRIGPGSTYIADVLPGALVMALGLALTVAPLTATVLASAGEENAGIASAVSNQVARTAGLISVAVLPAAVGISQAGIGNVAAFSNGFHEAVLICAGLCMAGGLLAAVGIRNPATAPEPYYSCPVGGPPLRLDVATARLSQGPDETKLSAP